MNKKEIVKLDTAIQDLCHYQDRIKKIREVLNIHPNKSFLNEVETIENLYKCVLKDRKTVKDKLITVATAGWTVEYLRNKNKYKKGEKFNLVIYFSFVEHDSYL